MPQLSGSALRSEHTGQELEEGRFSSAIRADQNDPLFAFCLKIDAAIHHVFSIRVVDGFELNGALAAALRLREFEIDLPFIVHGRFDFVHALNLLELGLGLSRFRIFGSEPVDEYHQPRDLAFLMLVSGQQLLLMGLALDQVIVVIPAVPDEPALPDFDDAADELVQKFAIV